MCAAWSISVINGGFGEWTSWGECQNVNQVGCAGFSARYRECSNPEPQHGGVYCSGAVKEVQPCSTC